MTMTSDKYNQDSTSLYLQNLKSSLLYLKNQRPPIYSAVNHDNVTLIVGATEQ